LPAPVRAGSPGAVAMRQGHLDLELEARSYAQVGIKPGGIVERPAALALSFHRHVELEMTGARGTWIVGLQGRASLCLQGAHRAYECQNNRQRPADWLPTRHGLFGINRTE
jgi:hypothetical protein